MRKSSAISEISKLFRRSPNNSAIQTALELLPEAAFMVDCQQNIVTLVNNNAIKLTAYTRQELHERSLVSIYPSLNLPLNGNYQRSQNLGEVKLIPRSGAPVHVNATFRALDDEKHWAILMMKPCQVPKKIKGGAELQKQRWQAIQLLAQSPQRETLELAIKQILQAGQVLTGASITAIYSSNLNENELALIQSWGNKVEFLPALIPQAEHQQLHSLHLWKKGDRAQSILERNAVAAQINYLATMPILNEENITHVIVVADQFTSPLPALSELLPLMTQSLTTAMHHFSMLTSLKVQISAQEHLLSTNEAIKEIVNDGIVFISPDLKIIEINAQAEKTLGYQSSEVQGKQLDQILIGSNSLMRVLQKAIETETLQDLGDVRLHRRDGQTLLAHLRAMPIQVNEEIQRNAIFITDLSAHEIFRQRTKQLEQRALLGEVTAIFAHEVRNPINNISTGLQVLKFEFENDNSINEQIDRLLQDCDRLTHLMSSTLGFSKSHEYKMEPQDIKILLENYFARISARLKQYNIELQTNFHQDLPRVSGDKRALEQVFSNIINNAINIMQTQKGGVLGIKVEPNTTTGSLNHINIDISDTGPGIPQATLDQIFQPFFTTHHKGTGLGLTIAQQIINAHSGQIHVESFPGGTVFKITLPTVTL